MTLLQRLMPKRADRKRWRGQERTWLQTGSSPQRIVRVYRSHRQLRRDARHLRRLGYELLFETTSRVDIDKRIYHVTYDLRNTDP